MGAVRIQLRRGLALLAIALTMTLAAQQQPPARRGGRPLPPNVTGGRNPYAPADPLAGPPRPTSAPPIDLSGAWKGAFSWDVMVELVDLTLVSSPDHRSLTGELRYTPIVTDSRRRARPEPEVTWQLTGRVDPGSSTVWLAPPPQPPRTSAMVAPSVPWQPLAGVFAAGRNEIAGQFRNPLDPTTPKVDAPYFLFVRAGEGKDRAGAVAKLKKLAEHAAEAVPPAPLSSRGSTPSDADLARWLAPLELEFGKNVAGGGVDQISARALPLLNDATFKPVFGDAYDSIPFGTLASGMGRAGGPVGGSRPDPAFVREHGYMQYVLWVSPAKIVSVAAMRTIDAWQEEALARFRSGPAVASAFDDLAATQKAIQDMTVYAWPSTRKRTDEAIELLRGQLSGSSLGANVEGAIAAASGLEGAKALASWSKDNAAMLQRLSAAERDAAQKRIEAQIDELLEPLIEPQAAQIAKLGIGEEAVRAGAAWYKAFQAQFGFASERPPVVQAVRSLAARRDPDLTAGSERLLQRIGACKTPEEVDAVFANDLSVPGDDGLRAYVALAEAGRKRKQAIEDERVLALFSPDERKIMDRPGHLDLSRAKSGPPSAEEIRLAMVRGWAYGTGKVLDAHTARHVDRVQSGFFLPFSMNVQFTQEKRISAERIGDTNDYDCQFQILMQMSLPDDNILANYDEVTRAQSVNLMKMVNAFCVAASSEADRKTLRLTEDGWVIPELMEAGAIQGALGKMLEGR